MDLSCIVESDRPIWATLRKSGRNIGGRGKRKEGRHGGRKWRHSSSYGNLHARTDVFFARKNASCSRTTGDGWWSVRIGNERCNCLRPRATCWCNELFCRMERKEWRSVKKKKRKISKKSRFSWMVVEKRIACVSSFFDPLFSFPSSASWLYK